MSLNDDEKKILKEKIRGQRREMWDGDRPARRPRSNRSSSQTTQEPLTEKQTNSDSATNVQGADWNEEIILPSQPSESTEMPVSNELTWKSYLAIALSAAAIIGLGFCLGYIFAS
ncbi:uncharacterized protein METZ01_LOCUS197421 [marine metagenome]|uniref:Uncharacterized protein n=1 Tax=marine metagenome TaxID=408172 RepID=A0A382E3X7_9ZZZZ